MLNSQEEVASFMLSKITVETTKNDNDDKSHDNKNSDGQEEGAAKAV